MMMSVVPAQQGIGIIQFTNDTAPAKLAGMPVQSIITSVNNTATPTLAAFQAAMTRTSPGQAVFVVAWKDGASATYTVTLGNDGKGRPILGIQALETTTSYYHPFTDADRYGGIPGALLVYISLPFTGRAPLQSPTTDFYVVTGPWAAVPEPVFYLLANALYWLFWLNLMLGMTNALPAVPLDGGYVFRDGLHALVARVRGGMAADARERVVKNVSYVFALAILTLIVWQLIGPWIF
jgi:membrane-associated protease RseP (regulator of RpoE activity)